jgi:hypothetical protein
MCCSVIACVAFHQSCSAKALERLRIFRHHHFTVHWQGRTEFGYFEVVMQSLGR